MIRRSVSSHSRVTIFGAVVLCSLLIAIGTFGTTPAQADLTTLVALGDSFTSGEGAPPFEDGTDTPTDRCHRSLDAYPLVAARLANIEGRNVACSGTRTEDLFVDSAVEPSQSSQIGDASVVLLGVGGNDVDALQAVFTRPGSDVLSAELAALEPALVQTYQKVKASADRNARIVVVGYPSIFPTGEVQDCLASKDRREYLVEATRQLDRTIRRAATRARVEFVDTFDAFKGHELCTTEPHVNGIDIWNIRYSLHPNATGQQELGKIVAKQLATRHRLVNLN